MKMNAEAIRPGSICERGGVLWKITSNDTLGRVLTLEELGTGGGETIHQSYEPGTQFDCTSIPHRRQERDRGDGTGYLFVTIVIVTIILFLIISISALTILTGNDSENRQSCLARNGSILEDESGNMTGCIIDREHP